MTAGVIVFSSFSFKYATEPFRAHKKLLAEPDFFDLKAENPEKAGEDLKKMLKNDPKNAKIYYKLG